MPGVALPGAGTRNRPWSREEVEATVADYFAMLREQLSGREPNKTEHRRRLQRLLDRRPETAIEFKHANISAAMLRLGCPIHLRGYLPRYNLQHLIVEVVASYLDADLALRALVEKNAAAPLPPEKDLDILRAMVEPPRRSLLPPPAPTGIREFRLPVARDYGEIEARNRDLGLKGELFALKYEHARLVHERRRDLARKIDHVSGNGQDGLGYDIRSFEANGEDRFIEVKTTAYAAYNPFFVTRRELETSRGEAGRFMLYRAFDFAKGEPRMYSVRGPIDHSFDLEGGCSPQTFAVRQDEAPRKDFCPG
jgi:Protein NO VEIN, C-terminal